MGFDSLWSLKIYLPGFVPGIFMTKSTHIRYNWVAIQKDCNSGLSEADITAKYGVSSAAIHHAKKRGDLEVRPRVESRAFRLANQRETMRQAGDHRWTTMSDLLDDMMVIIDYVDSHAK